MKTLDRYIAKNFLIGYAIAFSVLIGLRIIIDLFVNLDEFAEHVDLGTWAVAKNVLLFYSTNATLYFRDFAGVITVVAAAFSLGKMVRANELVAIIASGVSAKRIVGPILALAVFFTVLAVADQELLIPSISDKLVREHDDVAGQESYKAFFITDGKGSLICSQAYDAKAAAFAKPTIITRRRTRQPGIWEVTGRISADRMVYNRKTGAWDLVNGLFVGTESDEGAEPAASYEAPDLLPRDIPVRCKAGDKSLLSSWQLAALARQKMNVKDVAQLSAQRHFRITDPVINLTMLMVSLPVLICRDPKTMKSAIIVSFALTTACFITAFVCKMLAAEVAIADRIMPEFWAALPVFIFLPIAVIELDAMRT